MKRYLFALLIPLPVLSQEVGFPPEHSPYRDLEYRQELTGFAGWFAASKDPAGVAPQAGPMVGVRYELRIAGPAQLVARFANVFSERTIIDPAEPAATRVVGTESWPLVLGDVGISVNLTGQKSIRGFVPVVSTGLGVVSDTKGGSTDVGGYRFGTAFAFNFGGGVRWVPGGRFQLRADLQDYMYNIRYPLQYYGDIAGNDAVLPNTQSRTLWKHNAAMTLGGSYLFFR